MPPSDELTHLFLACGWALLQIVNLYVLKKAHSRRRRQRNERVGPTVQGGTEAPSGLT